MVTQQIAITSLALRSQCRMQCTVRCILQRQVVNQYARLQAKNSHKTLSDKPICEKSDCLTPRDPHLSPERTSPSACVVYTEPILVITNTGNLYDSLVFSYIVFKVTNG